MVHAGTEDNSGRTQGHRLPPALICLWLISLMLIAGFIRVNGVDYYHYSPDEAMHTDIASGGTLADVVDFSHYEAHPPLFYILCHYWMKISTDPAFVRCLPLLFGMLLIPLYYLIGRLLNGELTGMCCATLIAFSRGCIIQSYAVRHYTVFLVFLSLAFYFFLLWRRDRKLVMLMSYWLFGTAACFTHFSGVYAIFCVAACEAVRLLLRERRTFALWIAANLLIFLPVILIYHYWKPVFAVYRFYFDSFGVMPFERFEHALFYPYYCFAYILACPPLAAFTFILLPLVLFLKNPKLRAFLLLSWVAFGIGALLALTGFYPPVATRHCLWMLPFIMPGAAWVLTDVCKAVTKSETFCAGVILLLFPALGYAMYSPAARFADSMEYVITRDEWDGLSHRLDSLGAGDVIITERVDATLFENIYASLGTDAFSGASLATSLPYRQTHLLFNPYYPRFTGDAFIRTMQEAERRQMLPAEGNLVFLKTPWSEPSLVDLMLCDALDKRVENLTLPPSARNTTRRKLLHSDLVLITVSRRAFFDEVISPEGKAHSCFAAYAKR